MKNTFKFLAAIAFGAIFAASCEKPYEVLEPTFSCDSSMSVSISSGETVKVSFTLNDVREGDNMTASVSASPAESYDISVAMDPGKSSGAVTIVAPAAIYYDTPFDVVVSFNDKENERSSTNTITVKPNIKPLDGLNPALTPESITIKSAETAAVSFTLNDVRGNEIKAEASFDAPDYKVDVDLKAGESAGTVTVTAPEFILDATPFDILLTFTDAANNRTASAKLIVNPVVFEGLVKAEEHANTFFAAPGAVVSFPTFKGINGDKAGAESLELAWQDAAGLFAGVVAVNDGEAIVRFAEGKEGNALVNGLDAAGNVVWSWLFWIAGDAPQDVTVGAYTFMDRNIGAITLDEKSELSVGLAYQYGRKDPFPGIQFSQYALRPVYGADNAEVNIPLAINEAQNNLENTIKNPTIYYCNKYFSGQKHNYSWITTDATTFGADNFKALWENNGKKSDYDPCPAGYQVAPKAAWDGVKEVATEIVEIWDDDYVTFDSSTIGTNEKYAAGNRKKVQFRGCSYNGLRLTVSGEINANTDQNFSFANCVGKALPTAEVWMADIDPDYATSLSASYFRGMAVKVNTTGNGNFDDISSIKVNALSTTAKYGLNYAIPVRCVKVK